MPGRFSATSAARSTSNIVTFCNRCGDPVGLQLKYDVPECEERGMTYAAPLKVTIRLTVYDKDAETGTKTVRDIKEQEVFFGEIPLMTENGTFIINGTERVIVSQLHRSPGVFFERVPAQGYFLGKIIPYRGSWVEFEYDNKNLLYVRIDRKRKFYGTVFLRALGLKTDSEILQRVLPDQRDPVRRTRNCSGKCPTAWSGLKLSYAITKGGERWLPQGKKITNVVFKDMLKAKVEQVEVAPNDIEGAYVAADVVDMSTGEVLAEANQELTPAMVGADHRSRHPELRDLLPRARRRGQRYLGDAAQGRRSKSQNDALLEIYRKLRPGDPPTARHGDAVVPGHVLRPAQVRFLARRAHEVQHQAARQGRRDLARQAHARSAGLHRHHPATC